MTSKINLKTLFTMPMAPPPNKLSLHAKQFDGKTKERQCCARFYGGYCSLWPNRTVRSLSMAWPSLLRAHNHIGGATAVPLHHKKCLLCSVLIYIVLGDITMLCNDVIVFTGISRTRTRPIILKVTFEDVWCSNALPPISPAKSNGTGMASTNLAYFKLMTNRRLE